MIRDKYIEEIKEKISKELNLPSKEILFISYRRGSFYPFLGLPMIIQNLRNFTNPN